MARKPSAHSGLPRVVAALPVEATAARVRARVTRRVGPLVVFVFHAYPRPVW